MPSASLPELPEMARPYMPSTKLHVFNKNSFQANTASATTPFDIAELITTPATNNGTNLVFVDVPDPRIRNLTLFHYYVVKDHGGAPSPQTLPKITPMGRLAPRGLATAGNAPHIVDNTLPNMESAEGYWIPLVSDYGQTTGHDGGSTALSTPNAESVVGWKSGGWTCYLMPINGRSANRPYQIRGVDKITVPVYDIARITWASPGGSFEHKMQVVGFFH